MLNAVLLLACVASTIVLVKSNDDDSPPPSPPTCPPLCPNNEEYYNCIGGCVPRRCSELGYPLDCNKTCTPGCFCQDGYLRRDDGKCVPTNDCPSCGGDDNAQQGCGGNCNKMCSDIDYPPRSCPPACRFNACDCRPGFWYDITKEKCVKAEECNSPTPPPPTCPPLCPNNEEYYNCIGGCVPRRCSELGYPLDCNKTCTPGCFCQGGYLRRDDGKCVPTNDCPSCGGDNNAQQGCGTYCGGTCADIGKPPPSSCPIFCSPSGCACRPDFWYDINTKKCVKAGECTPDCPANEVYSSCTNGGCSARNCSQYGKQVPCVKIDPKYCIKGCICVEGYLRNSKGICVPKDQCKPKCDKPNEVFDSCSRQCPPRKCNANNALIKCRAPPKPGDPDCIAECRCIDDYYRNATGTCVPKKQCEKPIPCGKNQHYNACPMICPPQECGVNPALILCLPNPKYGDPRCRPGCVCDDGYLRDDSKKCVPKGECQKFPCGLNEEYQACPANCPGEQCSDYINNSKCPLGSIGTLRICRPQCKCIKGYYRDAKGNCIKGCDCPRNNTAITTTNRPPVTTGSGLTCILDGIIAFTSKCFYERMLSSSSENIIMSAMSVFVPIGELCLYSEGAAYDQCIRTLNLKDK